MTIMGWLHACQSFRTVTSPTDAVSLTIKNKRTRTNKLARWILLLVLIKCVFLCCFFTAYLKPPHPEPSKDWIIGAVLGTLSSALLLIWCILFIYFKCFHMRPTKSIHTKSPTPQLVLSTSMQVCILIYFTCFETYLNIQGLVEKFIGWPRYQMRFTFYSSTCSPHTSSISVAVFGFYWSKKSSVADMTSSSYELFSLPSYKRNQEVSFICLELKSPNFSVQGQYLF